MLNPASRPTNRSRGDERRARSRGSRCAPRPPLPPRRGRGRRRRGRPPARAPVRSPRPPTPGTVHGRAGHATLPAHGSSAARVATGDAGRGGPPRRAAAAARQRTPRRAVVAAAPRRRGGARHPAGARPGPPRQRGWGGRCGRRDGPCRPGGVGGYPWLPPPPRRWCCRGGWRASGRCSALVSFFFFCWPRAVTGPRLVLPAAVTRRRRRRCCRWGGCGSGGHDAGRLAAAALVRGALPAPLPRVFGVGSVPRVGPLIVLLVVARAVAAIVSRSQVLHHRPRGAGQRLPPPTLFACVPPRHAHPPRGAARAPHRPLRVAVARRGHPVAATDRAADCPSAGRSHVERAGVPCLPLPWRARQLPHRAGDLCDLCGGQPVWRGHVGGHWRRWVGTPPRLRLDGALHDVGVVVASPPGCGRHHGRWRPLHGGRHRVGRLVVRVADAVQDADRAGGGGGAGRMWRAGALPRRRAVGGNRVVNGRRCIGAVGPIGRAWRTTSDRAATLGVGGRGFGVDGARVDWRQPDGGRRRGHAGGPVKPRRVLRAPRVVGRRGGVGPRPVAGGRRCVDAGRVGGDVRRGVRRRRRRGGLHVVRRGSGGRWAVERRGRGPPVTTKYPRGELFPAWRTVPRVANCPPRGELPPACRAKETWRFEGGALRRHAQEIGLGDSHGQLANRKPCDPCYHGMSL